MDAFALITPTEPAGLTDLPGPEVAVTSAPPLHSGTWAADAPAALAAFSAGTRGKVVLTIG